MAEQPALILITRPEPQASQWVQALQDKQLHAQALPLIDISDTPDVQAVQTIWQALPSIKLLMFVSPNAAQAFARLRPSHCCWPANTLAAAPGPGTAQSLLHSLAEAGLDKHQIISPPTDSAQFDSEHLWPMLLPMPWQGQKVVIVSGGSDGQSQGRQWLSAQLQQAGASVSSLLTYQRRPAVWSSAQTALAGQAYAQPSHFIWQLSSSEAVHWLVDKMGPPHAEAKAITTHPRITATARHEGFKHIMETSPRLEDFSAAALQSLM
jgi:uroporphyrinogen-III synthase